MDHKFPLIFDGWHFAKLQASRECGADVGLGAELLLYVRMQDDTVVGEILH